MHSSRETENKVKFSRVSIVGLGYIGLPTAAAFASRKIQVIGVDVNPKIVEAVNRGEIHIIEPELDIAVHAAVISGYLKAVVEPEPADAFLVTVPTPFKEGHKPDLQYIEAASRAIARVLKKGDLVVLESTSPVGATAQMSVWMQEERPELTFPHMVESGSDINIAHCPERVLPGHTMRELIENDRVIGGMSDRCADRAVDLYRMIVEGECVKTDAQTAELAKLAENAFRDVNIAFANELSMICDRLQIDIWDLIALSNRHPRVNILKPGPGVGGHCIAVDPWFIVSSAPKESRLIKVAREVNDWKPEYVLEKILAKLDETELSPPRVACLGLTFKPDIDDLRESPALRIVKKLVDSGIAVDIVEPNISELPPELDKSICRLVSLESVVSDSGNLLVIALVAHNLFRRSEALHSIPKLDFCGIAET